MADISALGIKVTSDGVVKTIKELQDFSKAASAARQAASKPLNIKVGNTGIAKAIADIEKLNNAMGGAKGKGIGVSFSATGASAAIKEIDRFANAVENARAKAGGGITITLKANGSAAAVKNLSEFEKATNSARASAKNPINLNMNVNSGGSSGGRNGRGGFRKIKEDLDDVNKAFKFTAQEGLNFSRQMADIGVTAAMGMNPLMIALQQGPQLFDILQTSAIRNGTGIGGAFRGMAASAGSFTAALGLAAAAAGAAGAGMWAWLETINSERKSELEAYAASIGLTAEQIEKAGGAAVTASDMMLGLWDTIKEALGLEEIFENLGNFIIETFRAVAKDAIKNISEIVAAIRVIDDVVNFVGDNIGPIIADGFISAVNAGIAAIEGLVNKARAAFNKFLAFINPIRQMLGLEGIDAMADVSLGRLENKWAGTIKRGMALTGNFAKYRQETASGMYSFIDRAEENIVNRSKKRLDGAVDETTKKAKDAHKKAAKDAADEWQKELERGYANFIKGLNKDLGNLGKWMKEWEKGVDSDWRDLQKELKERGDAAERQRIEDQKAAEENRRKAFDAAYAIADIIGGAFGDLVGQLANAVIPLVDVTEKFGKILDSFAKGAALGGAVGGVTGSRTGGAIGGGIGQAVGESIAPMLGKLGKFAGPLGAIAGGILGGVIGGLVKKTPRASATVSIIAGEAMETAIKGSSDKLKKIAGGLADSVIDGLTNLADQLGAQLIGDANVSIGMRKKNYRVDPTGRGITKTSKGAIDFGEDQAAATAYAIQVAIQQGVLGGLSESMKRLIMADGDLQTQISKALSFKGVFDELAQNDDPAKWAQDEITKWHDSMAKIFAEAGATADELAELERLTGIKRAKAAEEAAEKIAQAEREALDRQREIRDKNIELLEAQGKIEEAEAMARQARIDDAPEYLRVIQQQIEAAHMLAAAEEKLAERRAIAAQNAQTEFGLMERLAAAQGDDATVKRLQRENELRQATSETERTYLLAIYAAEDFKIAQDAATAAQEAAAEAAKRIADERYGLETRYYQAIGDTATLRERELAALDPANQAFAAMIMSLEDLKAASDEVSGLNRKWLELTGQTDVLRQMDLDALLSDEARDIQKRIWALEDQKVAQEAASAAIDDYTNQLEEARNVLMQAYQRERGELEKTRDTFADFAKTIREFREGLAIDANPAASLALTQAKFLNTAAMARAGNQDAFGAFTGDAQAYLDAARSRATSADDYAMIVAQVTGQARGLEAMASQQVSDAQKQITLLEKQVSQYIDLTEKVVSVNDAISALQAITTEQVIPDLTMSIDTGLSNVTAELKQTRDDQKIINARHEEERKTDREIMIAMMIALNSLERKAANHDNGDSSRVTVVNAA